MERPRHYNDPLLDGLHTHFPAILYGPPEQFGGAAPLVSYVQSQVRERFDLFSAGQRAFTPTVPAVSQPQILTPPRRQRAMNIAELLNTVSHASPLDNYAYSIFNTIMAQPPQQLVMEPVIVRPTPEEIQNNTSIEIVDAEDEMCAICQDSMPAGSEARSLDACDHRFHAGCIDTWFMRDVRCPTCRHDIREPVQESS